MGNRTSKAAAPPAVPVHNDLDGDGGGKAHAFVSPSQLERRSPRNITPKKVTLAKRVHPKKRSHSDDGEPGSDDDDDEDDEDGDGDDDGKGCGFVDGQKDTMADYLESYNRPGRTSVGIPAFGQYITGYCPACGGWEEFQLPHATVKKIHIPLQHLPPLHHVDTGDDEVDGYEIDFDHRWPNTCAQAAGAMRKHYKQVHGADERLPRGIRKRRKAKKRLPNGKVDHATGQAAYRKRKKNEKEELEANLEREKEAGAKRKAKKRKNSRDANQKK
jgi:hypothetical protein